jgi:F-type H+-transporting ATPase subunit b
MKTRGFASLTLAFALLAPAAAVAEQASPELMAIKPRMPDEPQKPVPPPVEADKAAHGGHGDPTKLFNFFKLHYGKDQYGGKFGDGVQGPHNEPESPMSGPFAFMLINFGILLVLLGKFGAPVARKMAAERSDTIKSALDEAAKLRQAAASKLDEYSAKLKESEAEVTKLLADMRAAAEADKQRIMAAAEVQAAAVKKDAEQRIAAEIERARVELAREVAVAAASAAEKLVRERATSADHATLIDAFIKDVESAARGRAGVA